MSVKQWVLKHKLLLCLVAATAALGTATIVLAVQKANLSKDLEKQESTTVSTPTTGTKSSTITTTTSSIYISAESPTTHLPIDMEGYLLPRHIKPMSYDLTLKPNLTTGLFDGEVLVHVTVQKPTTEVWIHNNGLELQLVEVNSEETAFELDKKHELVIIRPKSTLPVGSNTIAIKYSGDMKNRIVGLYNSSYVASNGEKRTIATSKFEPTYARQAYPCFDEPNMKANFTVHILKPRDSNYIALSNMPQLSETETPEGTMVHFQESVKMSTYLSCFIVSDFIYKEDFIKPETDNVRLRVYSTPAQIEKTKFALSVAKKVIEFFIGYFQIPYPLPKLDLVAIPDFVSGAMEHWGLVTFRETTLLFDESTGSTANKQRVAEVVAHELAHSWFGNLVTMDWWNDLWLNEGFASYIEYKGVDAVHPDWQMLEQFPVDTLHGVLRFDATPASHPIVVNVTTPDEITEIFDTITYSKGASIVRMLEDTVGSENFKNATTNYLNKYRFGNAVTRYYMEEMQKVVGDTMQIDKFISTFTEQMGFPLVTVKEEGNAFVLTQQHFLTQPENKDKMRKSIYNYRWNIPVTYITDKDPIRKIVWLNIGNETVTVKKPDGASWVKFNYNQVGYYRVNYSDDHWNLLSTHMGSMTISDKMSLLDDSFSIAQAGLLSYGVPLELTKYLKDETNYLPWSVAFHNFHSLEVYLSNSPQYRNYLAYWLSLLKPVYTKLGGWDEIPNLTHLEKFAKGLVITKACHLGLSECLDKAKELFRDWLDNNVPIPQDFRVPVYKYGVKTGTIEDWEKVWEKYLQEIDASEKAKLMEGLISTSDPELLNKLIDLAKDEKYIRSQDYFSVLIGIAGNRHGTSIVWDYFRENWPVLVERFTLNDRYLGSVIIPITRTFSTKTKLEELEAFIHKYPEAGAGKVSRAQALETVRNNIKWMDKNKEQVESWIAEAVAN